MRFLRCLRLLIVYALLWLLQPELFTHHSSAAKYFIVRFLFQWQSDCFSRLKRWQSRYMHIWVTDKPFCRDICAISVANICKICWCFSVGFFLMTVGTCHREILDWLHLFSRHMLYQNNHGVFWCCQCTPYSNHRVKTNLWITDCSTAFHLTSSLTCYILSK